MKKLILTAAIILGFAMGSYAQKLFMDEKEIQDGLFARDNFYYLMMSDDEIEYDRIENDNVPQGGLFGLGDLGLFGMSRDGGTFSLCLPGHNFTTNWNGGSQGHDDDLLPLGNGALLLIGFGAAYALSKRKKED
jgi:hypothetical protein